MAGNTSRRGAAGSGRRTPAGPARPTGGKGGQPARAAGGQGKGGNAGRAGAGQAGRSGAGNAGRTGAGQSGRAGAGAGPAGRGGSGQGRPGGSGRPPARRRPEGAPELVTGRNPVVEALREGVPAKAMFVLSRIESDERVREAMQLAADRGLPLLEASKLDLDRMTDRAVHQGLVLQVPPYEYRHPGDLLEASTAPLLVALDGVTDPRNLGAVIRSVAAFGGHGVIVPERRAAGVTASAWKVSAGAAARVPVARATNLTRALEDLKKAGCFVVGLDADGSVELPALDTVTDPADPLVLVIGSEGKGLSRLVRQTCDVVASIPMAAGTESLNASVAAGVALYEIARRRGSTRR